MPIIHKTPLPLSAFFIAETICSTDGEANTEPIAQASKNPSPTYPVKTGRCPEPPPVTIPTFFEALFALVTTLLLSLAKE